MKQLQMNYKYSMKITLIDFEELHLKLKLSMFCTLKSVNTV